MRVYTAIHEVMGITVTAPQDIPSGRYQEIHATDIHGNRHVLATSLSNGCEGLRADSVVGLNFNDPTIAPCDSPLPTKEGLHA
jgi:hypothetical protein